MDQCQDSGPLLPIKECETFKQGPPSTAGQEDIETEETFNILYSNITSYSPHVKNYISNINEKEYHALALTEVHKDDELSVTGHLSTQGFTASYNVPEPTTAKNHGGECVAIRKHFNSSPIKPEIIEAMNQHFKTHLRFAARTIRFKGLEVLLITVYLWDSEGLTPRNTQILQQIKMLVSLTGLPFICVGDFNIHCDEFSQSEWPEFLSCEVIHPGGTTISSAEDRPIDFVLVSYSISKLINKVEIIHQVPWGPHYALSISVKANVKLVTGQVLCVPKALPVDDFLKIWKHTPTNEQDKLVKKSKKRAKHILRKQYKRTGIAILGKPTHALLNDIKYQGSQKLDAIKAGEKLAQTSLAAELLVLDTCQIPRSQQNLYTGRSQFPKFKTRTLINSQPDNKFSCGHLTFWGDIKGRLTKVHQESCSGSSSGDLATQLQQIRNDLDSKAIDHQEDLKDDQVSAIASLGTALDQCNQDTLYKALQIVKDTHNIYSSRLCSKIGQAWRQFVLQQLAVGGGTLFKYISKVDKQFLNVNWAASKGNNNSPEEFLQSQTDKWTSLWSPIGSEEDKIQVAECMTVLREAALLFVREEGDLEEQHMSFENYDKAVSTYKKNSLGSDLWSAKELDALPDEIKQCFVDSLNYTIDLISIPYQNLLNLHPCLGKPNGDCRTICKSPMLYRMFMRTDKKIREWEINNMEDYDSARIGGSALHAALKRNLRAEVAFWLGHESAAMFNDFEKFFDTIDIKILIQNALDEGFPPVMLALVLQQHLAPRVIQANGFSSDPMSVVKSILAGCKSSVALTRVYLKPGIKPLSKKHKQAHVGTFVDDTSMQSVGAYFEQVSDKLVPALADFGDVAKKLKLLLSPKAVISASHPSLALSLQRELKNNYGLIFKINNSARDLGIAHSAGVAKPDKVLKDRLKSKKNRISRTAGLAKVSRKARKLYTGSGFAATSFGHQGSGFTEAALLEIDRDALRCTGITEAGRCRAWGLISAYGLKGTPRARIIRETIREWFSLLKEVEPTELIDLRVAWGKAKDKVIAIGDSQIRGIISNIIHILHKADWKPVAINMWIDNNNNKWVLNLSPTSTSSASAPDVVASALIKAYADLDMLRAQNHYNGKGMGNGVHFNATLSLLRSLKPTQFADRSLLENILSAATWTADRIHSINPDYSDMCPRCGQEIETPFHCIWGCKANDNIQDEAVTNTQKLIQQATSGVEEEPCLWLRGILPSKYINIDEQYLPPENIDVTWVEGLTKKDDIRIVSGTYYGDASGGKQSMYPEIRRIGCAFAQIDNDDNLLFAAHFPLPGEHQSVPRGELYALVQLIEQAERNTELTYYTDNQYVHDAFNAGPIHQALCANTDLFRILFHNTINKAIKLIVKWMPSHLLDGKKKWPTTISMHDVKGNEFADKYADIAADQAEVPKHVSTPVKFAYYLAKAIQWRIITIIKNLPNRQKKQTILSAKELKPKQPLDELVENSQHILVHNQGRYYCKICTNSFSTKDKNFKEFVNSPCTDFNITIFTHSRPEPLLSKNLHVGNQYVHHTHKLQTYRGLVYCGKCGYRKGTNQVKRLAKPCMPPDSNGLANLKAISKGELPPNVPCWPLEEDSDESSSELELY